MAKLGLSLEEVRSFSELQWEAALLTVRQLAEEEAKKWGGKSKGRTSTGRNSTR